jgi:hypothetical protein
MERRHLPIELRTAIPTEASSAEALDTGLFRTIEIAEEVVCKVCAGPSVNARMLHHRKIRVPLMLTPKRLVCAFRNQLPALTSAEQCSESISVSLSDSPEGPKGAKG